MTASLADAFDGFLLDLDGVIYRGAKAVAHAAQSLNAIDPAGRRCVYVTNNASRPAREVAAQLTGLGIKVDIGQVVTSAQVAAAHLAARIPADSAVLVVGGTGLIEALTDLGLRPVGSLSDGPVAVVQGFHPDVGWRQLAEGSYAVAAGLPWVATNRDLTVPTERGIAPGNGTLVAAIESATGRSPVVVGKPEAELINAAAARAGAQSPLVVGDRLDTDVEAAARAGVPSLLVLTGVSTCADLVRAPAGRRPDYIAGDLRGLLAPPRHIDEVAETGRARLRCAGWEIEVTADDVRVSARGPDPVDGISVLAHASWDWTDQYAGLAPGAIGAARELDSLLAQG